MADAKRSLVIDFKAKGAPRLIKAIEKLANAQRKLDNTQKKSAKTQRLINHRVSSNTKAVQANTTALTKAQSAIAMYRNRMLLASFAVTFATTAFVNFVRMAGKQEDSVRRLSAVFGSEGAKALDEYSSELQKASVFGDENINVVMSQLGAFGANTEQTKALTKATIDLSAGLGLDLNTAGLLVAKTIGSTTDALTRYGVGADGATDKNEKIANVIKSVNDKFGDLGKKLSKTTSGQLAQASNAFGDFGEELGRVFAPMVLTAANALKFLAENLDAGKIKKFAATIGTLVVVIKAWNSQLVLQRGYWITRNALAAVYTGLLRAQKLNTIGLTIATKIHTVATLSLNKALATSNMLIRKNPIGLLIAGVAAAALAFANWKGWLDDTTEVLSDEDQAIVDAKAALDDYVKKVDEVNKSMEKKLALLKANTEIEKFAIENGIELADVNRELFFEIERVNQQLEEEKNLQDLIDKNYKAHIDTKIEMVQANISMLMAEQALVGNSEKLDRALENLLETEKKLITTREKSSDLTKEELTEYDIAVNSMSKWIAMKREEIIENNKLNTIEGKLILNNAKQSKLRQVLASIDDTTLQGKRKSLRILMLLREELVKQVELEKQQKDLAISNSFEIINSIQAVADAYINQKQAVLDADKAAALASANSIRSERLRARAVEKINEDFAQKQDDLNKKSKRAKRTQTVINNAAAIMEIWANKEGGTFFKIAMSALVAAQGRQQLRAIDAAKYEKGGLVGGLRHSQGGTIIEAERGEYIISRKGVEATGIEALNRINAGSGSAVNITFSGNVMSKDFIEDEAIPQIKEAIRRGADIGVG